MINANANANANAQPDVRACRHSRVGYYIFRRRSSLTYIRKGPHTVRAQLDFWNRLYSNVIFNIGVDRIIGAIIAVHGQIVVMSPHTTTTPHMFIVDRPTALRCVCVCCVVPHRRPSSLISSMVGFFVLSFPVLSLLSFDSRVSLA
eukprot:scaffold86123_cov24-Attheya_sp.AAC.1